MNLEAGRMMTASVRLVRVLGQGGMGSVWIADHLALNTQVAVKVLRAEAAANPLIVGRFTREASAAAQVKSPHIVQVFDHGVTSDGHPFIVMELLDGQDLGARITQRGALSLEEIAVLLAQACKALTKAHAAGIIHRDIKPENLFITDQDGDLFLKIVDFGIAKQLGGDLSSMTSTGTAVGTAYYMSPEQMLSTKGVDQRADLWSLGVVAYEAVTGALPFNGETAGALCVALHQGEFPPPSQRRYGIPPSIDAWMMKALNKDINQRFGSAKEMSDAFTLAVADARAMPALGPAAGLHVPIPSVHTQGNSSVTADIPTKRGLPLGVMIGFGALLLVIVAGVITLIVLPGPTPASGPRAAVEPKPAPSAAVAEPPPAPVVPGTPPPPSPPAAPPALDVAPESLPNARRDPPASVGGPLTPSNKPGPAKPKPTGAKPPPGNDHGF